MARPDINQTLLNGGGDAVRERAASAEPHRPNFEIPVTFDGEGRLDPGKELIKRILPDGPSLLAFIAGQSQAGKTFIGVKEAVCLASGESFFGYPVREKVGVIYVATEGEGAIDRRFKVGKDALGITRKLPIAVLKIRTNLADKKMRSAFVANTKKVAEYMVRARMCDRIGIVYIDTVAAAVAMRDENDNAEISAVCGYIRDIGHDLGCVMRPLIHLGKNENAGIRGGSNWTGHGDIVTSIYADRDKSGKVENRRVAISKHRDGEEGPLSGFELRFVELGVHPLYGDPYGSCVVEPCEADWKSGLSKGGSKGDTTFADAFMEIVLQCAEKRHVSLDGPLVDAVRTDLVRSEFIRRYGTGESSKDASAESKQRAWRRAFRKEINGKAYATETDANGVEWIWKL